MSSGVTLREERDTYAQTNVAIRAATRRWPQLQVADWNAYSSGKPWFNSDGLHMGAAGAQESSHSFSGRTSSVPLGVAPARMNEAVHPNVRAPERGGPSSGRRQACCFRACWWHDRPSTCGVPSNVGVPEVGAGVAHRPCLIGALRAALSRSRLVHVVAPAGAGKTTLLAQAVADLDAPVGWLTLEHWSRSPGRFLGDLALAVAASIPAVRAVLEQGQSEDPRELAGSVGTIIGDRELVLVVDNAHLLDEWPASAEVLTSLIRTRSRGMTIFLVGRFVPVIPGIGADVLAATSTIGDDVVQADITEAEAILAARGFDVDPFLALESSGGGIAGLVLEPGAESGDERPAGGISRG